VALYFVYRDPSAEPYGKRVRQLPDASVLDWVRRLRAAPSEEAVPPVMAERLETELGGRVYGLTGDKLGIVDRGGEEAPTGLTAVTTQADVLPFLEKHLWYWDDVRVDERSIRVRTDDDDTDLAWLIFDAEQVQQHPQLLSFLVHDEPRLPAAVGAAQPEDAAEGVTAGIFGGLQYDPLDTLDLGSGPGVTYVVDMRVSGSDLLDAMGHWQVTGVRLPDLGALVDDLIDELDISDSEERALSSLLADAGEAHVAMSSYVGQLYFFDDLWAAAHPDLAASLVEFADTWDPFAGADEADD
jgi:hypothetical protein